MSLNKVSLELDGLVIGQTQLVTSGGGVTVGTNAVINQGYLNSTAPNSFSMGNWTTATRPTNPLNGTIGLNTTLGSTEYYYNGLWYQFNSLGTNSAFVELWGAGGSGGQAGGWNYGAIAGGGGYTSGYLSGLLPGTTLALVIGQGGILSGTTNMFGGGAAASLNGTDNRYGGGGGGLTGIFLNSYSWANSIMIAGGGGGGGSSRAGTGNVGGGGGGVTGQNGTSAYDGKTSYAGNGGTQTAAGAEASSDSANTAGQQGQLQGGTSGTNCYGGGGGGGYYGGSGGGYSESNTMAGGGGGSGYLSPTYSSGGVLLRAQGQNTPVSNPGGYGQGGAVATNGNNGWARITKNGVTTTYSYTGSVIYITL